MSKLLIAFALFHSIQGRFELFQKSNNLCFTYNWRHRPSSKLVCALDPSQPCDGTRRGFQIVKTLSIPKTIDLQLQEKSQRDVRDNGLALPSALHFFFPEIFPTMSAARRTVRRGEILDTTNGIPVQCNVSTIVGGGESLQIQKRLQPGLVPKCDTPFQLDVIYEDDDLAVVIKPPDISSMKGRREFGRPSMRTGLAHNLRPTTLPDALFRPQPCHRLDTPTGGLLLVAKTHHAISNISSQFAARQVRKRYVALVMGRPRGDDGGGRGVFSRPLSGQEAVTEYEVTESVRSLKYGWVSAVSLRPHTGRTHQLRRHLQLLGHPIVGDKRYLGTLEQGPPEECGLMLWAANLELAHPADGRPVCVAAPPPPKFAEFLECEAGRWARHHGFSNCAAADEDNPAAHAEAEAGDLMFGVAGGGVKRAVEMAWAAEGEEEEEEREEWLVEDDEDQEV